MKCSVFYIEKKYNVICIVILQLVSEKYSSKMNPRYLRQPIICKHWLNKISLLRCVQNFIRLNGSERFKYRFEKIWILNFNKTYLMIQFYFYCVSMFSLWTIWILDILLNIILPKKERRYQGSIQNQMSNKNLQHP